MITGFVLVLGAGDVLSRTKYLQVLPSVAREGQAAISSISKAWTTNHGTPLLTKYK